MRKGLGFCEIVLEELGNTSPIGVRVVIKDIDIDLDKGNSISIECNNDISDLLVNLILGRETSAKGEIYI